MPKVEGLVHRPVVFNPHDLHQAQLLAHAKRYTNFSGYVKRLIERDMKEQNGQEYSTPIPIPEPIPEPDPTAIPAFDINLVI